MRPHIVRSRGFYLNQMGADDDVCPWLIRLSNSRKSGRNCQMKGRPAGLSPRRLLCDQSPPLLRYRWDGLYSSLMGCPECLPLEQSSWVRVLRRWTFEFSGEKLSSVAGPSTTRQILKVEVFTNATGVFYRHGRHLTLAVLFSMACVVLPKKQSTAVQTNIAMKKF